MPVTAENLSSLRSLQYAFASAATKTHPEAPLPNSFENGALDAKEYATTSDTLKAALTALEQDDLTAASTALKEAYTLLYRQAGWLERNAKEFGRFSDSRALVTRQAKDLKERQKELESIIWSVDYAEKKRTEENAADDTISLLRRAQILEKDYSGGQYSNISDLKKLFVLAAENQLRQEKLIKDLTEKVAKLEEKLGDYEAPVLDKKRIEGPSAP